MKSVFSALILSNHLWCRRRAAKFSLVSLCLAIHLLPFDWSYIGSAYWCIDSIPSTAYAQARRESNFLERGIRAYHAGNYGQCIELLGASPSDFNNARLHYYLGSSYLKTGNKSGSIREFRIAYAIEPESEIGKNASRALQTLGAGPDGTIRNTKTESQDYTKRNDHRRPLRSQHARSLDEKIIEAENQLINILLKTEPGSFIMPKSAHRLLEKLRDLRRQAKNS